MTSQEQLAKIGQAALDARAEGMTLPARLHTLIRQAEAEAIEAPTVPGLYLMKVDGKPDRTALLTESGTWHMDGLRGPFTDKSPVKMREYLLASGRSLIRIYTAVEAQKLAADAVNLSSTKLNEIALRIERKRGQDEIIGYIDSINQPNYSALCGELLVATRLGGILHVKVDQ